MEIYSSNAIRWMRRENSEQNTENFRRISDWWESQARRTFQQYHTNDSGSSRTDPQTGYLIIDFNTGHNIWDPPHESFTYLGEFVASNPTITLPNSNASVAYSVDVDPIQAYVVDVDFDRNLLILWFGNPQQARIYDLSDSLRDLRYFLC